MKNHFIIRGFRSIEECLHSNSGKILKILVSGKPNSREEEILTLARKKNIAIEKENTPSKDGPRSAECLSAILKEFIYADFSHAKSSLEEKIKNGEKPCLLALDGIQDPQNFGAIIRTAAFMGIDGILIPKDRSASVNETVYRISSGGLEYVQIMQVANLSTALDQLKKAGFWVVGFTEKAEQKLHSFDQTFPSVIVIGSEEKGMRPLIENQCDHLLSLEGRGAFSTLNASVAAALAMSWATDFFSRTKKT